MTEGLFMAFARGFTALLDDGGAVQQSLLGNPSSALQRWETTMQWLDGPMVTDESLQLRVVQHILDYLQKLLNVHPNYGGRR